MKTCPVSKLEFQERRSNQIYYSSFERRKHNNDKNNAKRRKRAFVEKPLKQNFNILEDLLKDVEVLTVHREYLKGRDYSFGFYTHYTEYNGKNYPATYNYILMTIADNQIKILKTK